MNRKIDLDILKVIGLLCIILAHVNPPGLLFQIRNFDVVLMILISAYLGYTTYNKTNYRQYVIKRFKRLIIPTWIFLTFYFFINCLIKINNYNINIIIDTYLLNEGIGYVWIIRVYFIIALFVPVFKKINEGNKRYLGILTSIILFILYEIACHYGVFSNIIIMYFFAYIIPCYLLIIISYYLFKANNKKVLLFAFINLSIFILIGLYLYKTTGRIVQTQTYKYPFRIYYLTYALLVSSILIFLLRNKTICIFLDNKMVRFVSKNSLWIYLWHILFINLISKLKTIWILEYAAVLVLSILLCLIQSMVVNRLEGKVNKEILKVFK